MRPVRVTVGSQTASDPVILDNYQTPFNVGIATVVSSGATLTFTVEVTYDDVFAASFNPATATWFPITALTSKSANTEGSIAFPVMAVRINVGAYTDGDVTMTVIQAGGPAV